MPVPYSESNSSSAFWKEFTSATTPALGTAIDLTAIVGSQGRACREIIMLASGTLNVLRPDGTDGSTLTSLDAGTNLPIQAITIKATQTAAILVLW